MLRKMWIKKSVALPLPHPARRKLMQFYFWGRLTYQFTMFELRTLTVELHRFDQSCVHHRNACETSQQLPS